MAVLNGCCCCFSLKTGVIIISVLYLVGSFLQVGLSANSLHKHQYIDKEFDSAVDAFNQLTKDIQNTFDRNVQNVQFNIRSESRIDINDQLRDVVHKQLQFTKSHLIASIVFGSIQILCGLLLLFGAIQEKAPLLVPYLLVETLLVIGILILYIVVAVNLFTLQSSDGTLSGVATIIGALIYGAISLYFLLVVYSLYQEIQNKPRHYV